MSGGKKHTAKRSIEKKPSHGEFLAALGKGAMGKDTSAHSAKGPTIASPIDSSTPREPSSKKMRRTAETRTRKLTFSLSDEESDDEEDGSEGAMLRMVTRKYNTFSDEISAIVDEDEQLEESHERRREKGESALRGVVKEELMEAESSPPRRPNPFVESPARSEASFQQHQKTPSTTSQQESYSLERTPSNPFGGRDKEAMSSARRAIFDGEYSGEPPARSADDEALDQLFDTLSQRMESAIRPQIELSDQEGGEGDNEDNAEGEEEEEMEENEDVEVEASQSRAAAARKITQVNCGARKDKRASEQAQIDAVHKKINDLSRAKITTIMVAVGLLLIEDEEELKMSVVEEMAQKMEEKSMNPDAETFLAWSCLTRKRHIVEDGRHRLKALNVYIDRVNARREESNRINKMDVEVRVQVIAGGKICALLRKLRCGAQAVPTVFERTIQTRFIMAQLGMIENSAMTMQIRSQILNKKIRSVVGGNQGTPMYMVQSACLSESEFKFIIANARTNHDGYNLLIWYQQAMAVNPTRALQILNSLDGERNEEISKLLYQNLQDMHNNIGEMLIYKGYREEEARDVQDRIYQSKEAYSAMKRLMSSKSHLTRQKEELQGFMLGLERCLPPVTFKRPKIYSHRALSAVRNSTLYIMDYEAFEMSHNMSAIVNLVKNEERTINFIIVGADEATLRRTMNDAMERRRTENRRSSSQQSQETQGAQFDVGAASLSIQCATFMQARGSSSVSTSTVMGCLMRAMDGDMLSQSALGNFLNAMQIEGTINRTCLRLLTFDATRGVTDYDWNPVFVDGHSPGPFAVAARASVHRINCLTAVGDGFKREMQEKQDEMKNDWNDYVKYKDYFTSDGKVKPTDGMKKKRNRGSKLKTAVLNGLL